MHPRPRPILLPHKLRGKATHRTIYEFPLIKFKFSIPVCHSLLIINKKPAVKLTIGYLLPLMMMPLPAEQAVGASGLCVLFARALGRGLVHLN